MRRSVKLGLAIAVLGGVLVGLRAAPRASEGLPNGTPAPAFKALALDGSEFDSSALRGHGVVLNFWATWCAPCVAEMPSLQALHRALGPEGLRVVAVALDDDPAAAQRFATRRGLTFTVLRDPASRAATRFAVDGLPTTVLIDVAGVVRGVYVGPVEWDTPGAIAELRKLLRARAATSTASAR